MRIRVSHETVYRYAEPPKGVIQTLRMTPRNHDGQYVDDCRLDAQEDAFGNITHSFSADGPFDSLRLLVEGVVETQDTHGVMRGTIEHFPASLFLRTPRSRASTTTSPSTSIRPMRPRRRRRRSRSNAACARISPTSSSRRHASSACRPAMWRATFIAPTGW